MFQYLRGISMRIKWSGYIGTKTLMCSLIFAWLQEQEEMNLAEEEAKKPKKELTAEEKAEQLRRLEELRVKKAAERVEREKQVWH